MLQNLIALKNKKKAEISNKRELEERDEGIESNRKRAKLVDEDAKEESEELEIDESFLYV